MDIGRRFSEGQVIVDMSSGGMALFSSSMAGAEVILKDVSRFRAATREEDAKFRNKTAPSRVQNSVESHGGSEAGTVVYDRGMKDITDDLRGAMDAHRKMMYENKTNDAKFMDYIKNGGANENKLTNEGTYSEFIKSLSRRS